MNPSFCFNARSVPTHRATSYSAPRRKWDCYFNPRSVPTRRATESMTANIRFASCFNPRSVPTQQSDQMFANLERPQMTFQSTLRAKAQSDKLDHADLHVFDSVSIHAPCQGTERPVGHRHAVRYGRVSIHAPCQGTERHAKANLDTGSIPFQSTLGAEAQSDKSSLPTSRHWSSFNPRSVPRHRATAILLEKRTTTNYTLLFANVS